MSTVLDFLKEAASRIHSDTPDLDAQVLLANILDKSRSWLTAYPETHLTNIQLASARKALSRLEAGEPLPYIVGHWEFFGLDFEVTPAVLIPRPETELLVEHAIKWIKSSPTRHTIADIGTGSGCIAVSIAKNLSNVKITATDISKKALKIARRNAKKHKVNKQIEFIYCDLLPSNRAKQKFNLVCANLPYIPTQTLQSLEVYKHEPAPALDGGVDGLDIVRQLLKIAPERLVTNGMILLEINASQGMAAVSLAYDLFDNAEIHLHQDLAGHDRLVEIRLQLT